MTVRIFAFTATPNGPTFDQVDAAWDRWNRDYATFSLTVDGTASVGPDDGAELKTQLRIRELPTVVFFEVLSPTQLRSITRIEGPTSPDQVYQVLRAIDANHLGNRPGGTADSRPGAIPGSGTDSSLGINPFFGFAVDLPPWVLLLATVATGLKSTRARGAAKLGWGAASLATGSIFLNRQAADSGIGALHSHRFVPVYNRLPNRTRRGVTNISHARGKSGVYIIKEDGVIVYVGYASTDLYRVIMRHFQKWEDWRTRTGERIARVTYRDKLSRHRYTVRLVYVRGIRRIDALETALIRKYQPRDNIEKLDRLREASEERRIEAMADEYTSTPVVPLPADDEPFDLF